MSSRDNPNIQQPSSTQQERTPNDQRSDVKNQNSSEYKNAQANRSGQLNPNDPKFDSSRAGNVQAGKNK